MAKVTNAFDTYTATADREDLSNIIYNISPMQTPFMSSIGKRSVKNVVFDWQTESLPTPSSSGELEGFELSRAAATATVRQSNVCMISKRDATVTGSQESSDPAGKRSEMAHQLAIMSKALKRDMEEALCQNGAKTTGELFGCRRLSETRAQTGEPVHRDPGALNPPAVRRATCHGYRVCPGRPDQDRACRRRNSGVGRRLQLAAAPPASRQMSICSSISSRPNALRAPTEQ